MTINDENSPERARMEFGGRVSFRRAQLGLTQDALSELVTRAGAPLTRDKIAKIERGARPTSVEEIVVLARCLETRPGALLGDLEDMDTERVLYLAGLIHKQRSDLLRAAEELQDAQRKLNEMPAELVERVRRSLGFFHENTLYGTDMSPAEFLAMQEEDGDDPDDVRDRRDDR